MGSALLITLRETIEAALIVGIVLAYLDKTLNQAHKKFVWYGVFAGGVFSVVLAFVFQNYLGGFEGRNEELYEGFMMLFASGLLTWMILWMLRQRHYLKKNLENKIDTHIKKDYPFGIFLIVVVSIIREGTELVIFLQGAQIQAGTDTGRFFFGVLIGFVAAVLFSYLLFKGVAKISLRKFFTFTSILLILFAAGLFAHAVHELQEAGMLPVYIEHLWDINFLIDEKGIFGSLLKSLFGYNGNPSLLEVAGYWVYLLLIAGIWYKIDGRKGTISV